MWMSVAGKPWARVADPSPAAVDLERALVLRGLGRHTDARRMLLAAARRAKNDPLLLQNIWWALAGTERFLGNLPSALASFQNAARLARRNGDALGYAYALCGEAACHRILGHAGPALSKYRAAYGIFVREKDRFGTAYGLCGMGNAHRVYGDARRCLPLYQKSFKLYMALGDEGSAGFALWGLGGAYRRMGKFSEARSFYRKSLAHFKRDKDRRGEVMAHLGLARVVGEAGDMNQFSIELSAARRLAAQGRLAYEAALARALQTKRASPLSPFGVTAKAYSRWRDLP
jgi:tetratricopeptide (TPR) repeat protein